MPAAACPLQPPLADELAERSPDGDQAAAVAGRQVALGRQAIAGLPLAVVEGGLAGPGRPGDGAGWGRARVGNGPSAGVDLGRGSTISGLARAAIADNVISNPVKPLSGERPWASRSPSWVAAAPTRRSWSRASSAARRACRSTSSCCSTSTLERLDVVGGLAQRMLDRLDWVGRLTLTGDRDARHRRRRLRAHPAARRRPGDTSRRRDAAAPLRRRSARRRPAPAASPRRCGPCRSSSSSRSSIGRRAAPGAWIVDFTNPVGIVTQALLDARPPRASGCATSRSTSSARSPSGSASAWTTCELEHVGPQPPELGARGAGSTASIGCRSCWRTTPTGWPTTSGCPVELIRAARRDPVVLPALLLRDRQGRRRAAGRRTPGHRTSSTSRRACSTCTATRGWPRSRRSWPTAAAPTTARPPPS